MVTDTVEDTIKGVKQGETAIVTAMKRPYKEFCHAIIDAEIEDIDITYYENIFDQHHHVKLSDILRTLAPTLYTCTIDNRIFAKLEGELEHLYEEVHVKMEGKTIQAPTGKTE